MSIDQLDLSLPLLYIPQMLPTETLSILLSLRTMCLDRSSRMLGSSSSSIACSSMDGMSPIVVRTWPRWADEMDKLLEGARDFSVDVACNTSKRKVFRSAYCRSVLARDKEVDQAHIEEGKVVSSFAYQETLANIG